jgi:hypothetical protein
MSTENLETMGPEEEITTTDEVEMDSESEEEETGMTDEQLSGLMCEFTMI